MVAAAPASPRTAARNELCPCGSGRQRKKCGGCVTDAPLGLPRGVRRKLIAAWPGLSQQQRAKLAACDPVLWAMYASGGSWFPAPHLEYLADALLEVVRGEVLRLSVSLPPQHGKSEFISKYFPSWFLGRFPAARVLQVSYGQDLTVEWTAQARDLFAEHGPSVFKLDTWSRSKRTAWNVYRRGRRTGGGIRGVGKGGAVAGRAVDLGLLDDTIKDQDEADSLPQRERTFKWLRSVVFPRAKRLINIGTRWHGDDPIGRLMAAQKKGEVGTPWKFVNIPAVAEADDPLGRAVGEPLWLANPLCMGDPDWYRKKELDVGPYVWSALYQGHPTPAEGSLYKKAWLTYFDEDRGDVVASHVRTSAAGLLRYVTVDPAWSKKTSADYSVVATWGLDRANNRLFLLDLVRKRFTAPELAQAMKDALAKSGATVVYVEAQNLKLDEMAQIRRSGVPMREIQPNTDKVARFMPVQAHAARGGLLFRRGASWLPDLERELLEFGPSCEHDDQVDAVSYGVHVANEFAMKGGAPPQVPERSPGTGGRSPVPGLRRPT